MAFRFGTQRSLGLPIGGGGAILKPQDVFATSLYNTPAGNSVRVSNGIDLAGRGGLAWEKFRTAEDHLLVDTLRGPGNYLGTNSTAAEQNGSGFRGVNGFYSNGYESSKFNTAQSFVGWSFARAAKFFDIVTWTGDGTSNRQISHGLGVVPGMVIVKRRDAVGVWPVYHRSTGRANVGLLNQTDAFFANASYWGAIDPTETTITVGNIGPVNAGGGLYVAYLFAHDPSADGIVQCGSFTSAADGSININLGWRPQFFLVKNSAAAGDWYIVDTARGWPSSGNGSPYLSPNTASAEGPPGAFGIPTATGITGGGYGGNSGPWVYLAIRAPY